MDVSGERSHNNLDDRGAEQNIREHETLDLLLRSLGMDIVILSQKRSNFSEEIAEKVEHIILC